MATLEEKLRQVGAATVTHELLKKGVRTTFMVGVLPLRRGLKVIGRAATLRFLPMREDLAAGQESLETRHLNHQRQAIEAVQPGEVLVIDARGITDAGTVGDVLSARVRSRGGAGIVTDGAVRDSEAILAMDFPVFVGGVHGQISPFRHWAPDHNVPIQCGGVTIIPGDIIMGDDDGVVVIPAAMAEEIATLALDHERQDAFSRENVEAGVPIHQAYPLDAALLAEFRRREGGGGH